MSSPARLDLTNIVSGDDVSVNVVIVDDAGSPVNLTGRSYVAQIRSDPASTNTPQAAFTCTTPTPANGTIQMLLPDTESDNLSPSSTYWWSLLEVAGSVMTTLIWGRVTVIPQVSKD